MPRRPEQENLYIQRVNAVVRHIRDNLNDDLSLDTLARAAGLSPFHFHRIFKSITTETANECVVRLRLERVASLLRSTPKLSITAAAFECGFHSPSVFSRAFKKHYGLSARQWDRHSPLKNSKNGQVIGNFPCYILDDLRDIAEQDGLEVRLRSLPAQRLAYIRVYDSFSKFSRVKEAYHRLIAWHCRRGGRLENTTLYGMSQDDPGVTPRRLCRFDWCVRVPPDWKAEGEVSVTALPACRVATVRCLGDVTKEDRAIQYLIRHWLPRSRYQPANLPLLEIYRRPPDELGWKTFDMDCAVPIVPL